MTTTIDYALMAGVSYRSNRPEKNNRGQTTFILI